MKETQENLNSLIAKWCKDEQAVYTRQLELLRSGTMRTSESRDGRMVDTTKEAITEIERRTGELDRILDAYARLKQDSEKGRRTKPAPQWE
jgi:hypothetical protein